MTTISHQPATGAPDVSVIMPAWKAAAFIEKSIASVLASTGVSLELVIIDDASPDDTFDVLQRHAAADPRIRVDRMPANSGPSGARNRAIERSRGRYIAVVDSDDTILSERLAKLVALGDSSRADIVVDNMIEVDTTGARIDERDFLKSQTFAGARPVTLADYVHYNRPLKSGDCLGYLKPLFRRETLQRLDARYDTRLRNSEDYYLVANLLAGGASMIYSPYAGYLYQRAEGSTSHRLTPTQTAAWLQAERDFMDRHASNLDPDAARVLKSRGRLLRDVHQFVSAIGAIKERRPSALFKLLASDPHATAFTLSWFAKIAWEKLARAGRKHQSNAA